MAMQRDYIIEGEDRITIGGSEELQTMVDRLPATPLLSVTDVAAALDLSRDVIYAWIDSGQFKIFAAHGHDRNFYRIFRGSFIAFLRSRII